jgi:hypothetical protein
MNTGKWTAFALIALSILLISSENSTPEPMDQLEKCILEPAAPTTDFPTWKTINIGEYKTGDAYINALKTNNLAVESGAVDIIKKMPLAPELQSIELVRVTPKELGLRNGSKISHIYYMAKQNGLELCPAEIGPALRLAYADQPTREAVIIAMEPIAESSGKFGTFILANYSHKNNELPKIFSFTNLRALGARNDVFIFIKKKHNQPPNFPVWRTVTIGKYKSAGAYLRALKNDEVEVDDHAIELLKYMFYAQQEQALELVQTTVRDIGFTEITRVDKIYKRVLELGDLLPAEVGPALRLQYREEKLIDELLIVMEPVVDEARTLGVFRLQHEFEGMLLSAYCDRPDCKWAPHHKIVFLRRK